MPFNKNIYTWLLVFFLMFVSCNSNKAQYKGPAGYDMNKPEKFLLPNSLHEISGISFLNDTSICAIEDETGKLFYFNLGNEKINHSKFAKKGDFEDVAVWNKNSVAVLKSNGSIFLFSAQEIGKEKIDSVKEYDNILPEGEYEGLCAAGDKLFALCKNCADDKEKKEVSVFIFQQDSVGVLQVSGTVKIDLSPIRSAGNKAGIKGKFHPSCIAKNPVTGDWYIISSVNKLLLVLDEQFKIKESFPLKPSLFKQPEGMAFNAKGDLYISNEGGEGAPNILLFRYQKI